VKSKKAQASTPAKVFNNPKEARAFLNGVRQCYGVLNVVLAELSIEAKNRHLEKMKALDEIIRDAEKESAK
jgi:hypothetical protein